MTATAPVDTTDEHKQLASAFQFTKADLKQNREGVISEAQKERLRRMRVVSSEMLLAVVVGLHLTAFIGGSTAGAVRTIAAGAPSGVIAPLLVIVLSVWGLTVFTRPAIQKWRSLSRDVKAGEVKLLQGDVQHKWVRLRYNRFPCIATEDDYVRVKETQQTLFTPGERYAIYVAPHSDAIVAAERLP